MIRNFSGSGGSQDLSAIYNSLQTINALLYRLDSQTTLTQAMSSLQGDMNNLETKVDDLASDVSDLQDIISTITFDNVNVFITDRTLTTNITDYNTYNNTNLIIFEPYVQLVTDYNYISTSNSQRYNIPNATLNFTDTTTPRVINYNTIGMVSGGLYTLSKCEIGTLTDFVGGLIDCTVEKIDAETLIVSGCDINSFYAKGGQIMEATFDTFQASSCSLFNCSIKKPYATTCNFINCTLDSVPGANNIYESMTLKDMRGLQDCTINNCVMKLLNTSDAYCSTCSLNNITLSGTNSIRVCTINGITNNDVCDIRNCTINNVCELNNAGTIENCLISKLKVKPGIPTDYSFRANRISTLIIPNYMTNTNLTAGNTISSFVTY